MLTELAWLNKGKRSTGVYGWEGGQQFLSSALLFGNYNKGYGAYCLQKYPTSLATVLETFQFLWNKLGDSEK